MTQNELIAQFPWGEDDTPAANGEHEVLFQIEAADIETLQEAVAKLLQLQADFEVEFCEDGYVEILVKHLA